METDETRHDVSNKPLILVTKSNFVSYTLADYLSSIYNKMLHQNKDKFSFNKVCNDVIPNTDKTCTKICFQSLLNSIYFLILRVTFNSNGHAGTYPC